MNKKQIIAYYMKNMLNSEYGVMNDMAFVQNMPLYSLEVFDFDIQPLFDTLPDDMPDESKVAICRDILNGKIDLLDDSNLGQTTKTEISNAIPKMQVSDITDYNFDKNLSVIFDAFNLPQNVRKVLQLFIYIPKMPNLRDVLENLMGPIDRDFMNEDNANFFEQICGVPTQEIKNLFAPKSILFTSGILVNKIGNIRFTENFKKILSGKYSTPAEVRNILIGDAITTKLTAKNFIHMKNDFDMIKDFLKSAVKNETRGVNILIWGNAGCGKTTFATVLATAAGLKLYSGCESDDDKCDELKCKLELLKNDSNAALLFDNATDALEKFHHSSSDRLLINEILESGPRPVIWIVNDIDDVDKSYLHRFSLCTRVTNPDDATKKTVWGAVFKQHRLKISDSELSKIAKNNDAPLAVINTAVKNAKISGNIDMIQYTINKLVQKKKAPQSVQKQFNTNLLNTDTDLKVLADRIAAKNLKTFSLCLYGAPGTGKTAYADYIGNVLNMPVIKKRASDLKGSFVGETERNIAAAFATAREKKAILVFDEADSFLQNRATAHQAWEFGLVNEMLTQMENAEYPFICTTNLMDTLDSAALRRFTFKIKYDFLTIPMVVLAFQEFFGITVTESMVQSCDKLAPGDFVVVKNKATIMDITDSNELIKMLLQEQSVKSHNKNRIGF